MIEFDAAGPPEARPDAIRHVERRGRRVTDAAATFGAVVWLASVAAAWAGYLDLDVVDHYVGLAALVFVPLGLGLAATSRRSGGTSLPYRVAVAGQFPATALVLGALVSPVGSLPAVLLVLPWLAVAAAIGAFGLWRLRSRGLRPLPELSIDAATLYLPVGAVALLLHAAGVGLGFEPIIVQLTAVHYHYAGFVLPLVAGLAGRAVADEDGRFRDDVRGLIGATTTLVIVVNLALIAVGITFSPLVEVVAVAFFTVAVAAFAVVVILPVSRTLPTVPGGLLLLAALAIVGTMALALAYGYSAFPLTGRLITIGEMVRWHGSVNAFGFALPALLAFRLAGE